MSLFNPTGMKAIDVAQKALEAIAFNLSFIQEAACAFKNEIGAIRRDIAAVKSDITAMRQLLDGSKIERMQKDLVQIMDKHIRLSIELENKLGEKGKRFLGEEDRP